MILIDGDRIITAQLYDDEHEEFTEKKMSIIDYINAYTNEGVTEAEVVAQTDVPVTNVGDLISRQAAIDALSHMMDTDGFRDGWAVSRANVDCMLRYLPSVEPYRKPELGKFIEKVFETLREMDDAVDVICNLDVDAVLDRMEVDV